MRFSAFSGAFAAATFCFFLLAAMPGQAHDYRAGEMRIGHPWSRATPPGAKVAAGYLELTNEGSESDRLISATAEISGRSEIHEMSVGADGVMTMRPLADGIDIPAGAEISLKPGGHHIMFLDLEKPLVEGERIKGTLTFEKAGTVDVEFAVEAMGARQDQEEESHHEH